MVWTRWRQPARTNLLQERLCRLGLQCLERPAASAGMAQERHSGLPALWNTCEYRRYRCRPARGVAGNRRQGQNRRHARLRPYLQRHASHFQSHGPELPTYHLPTLPKYQCLRPSVPPHRDNSRAQRRKLPGSEPPAELNKAHCFHTDHSPTITATDSHTSPFTSNDKDNKKNLKNQIIGDVWQSKKINFLKTKIACGFGTYPDTLRLNVTRKMLHVTCNM